MSCLGARANRLRLGALAVVAMTGLMTAEARADVGDGVVAHDLDGDGADDVTIEYELWPEGDWTSIWTIGRSSRSPAGPFFDVHTPELRPWWDGLPGGWDAARSHPVTGDFDGNGKAEVASLYDYPGDDTQVLWEFRAGAAFPQPRWHSGESGPIGASMVRVVSGDFDGDGFDDVLAFGDPAPARTRAMLFSGGVTGLGPMRQVWDSGPGNWDLSSSKIAAGDFDGDGFDDVVLFYGYSIGVVRLWMMSGNSLGLSGPVDRWNSCLDCWEFAPTRLATGDFDGDGFDDVGLIYDYGNASTGWWMVPGLRLAEAFGHPDPLWLSDPGAFDSSRARITGGDFDGDGRDELRLLYDYAGGPYPYELCGACTRLWSLALTPPGVVVDIAAPPLMLGNGGGWASGVTLTAFDWSRTRLI